MAVTDLTNTKWLFNESISSFEDVTYHINFISNNTSFSQLLATEVNYKILYDSTTVLVRSFWQNEAYRTIEITGGTDVINASLISWLEANATQITSGGSMYLGTSTISKMYLGQNEVSKVYLGQDLVYEKQASTTISFSIDNITYQADEGMTWGEWVNSSYNTGGYVISTSGYVINGSYNVVGIVICDFQQTSTTQIIPNQAYIIFPNNACD